MNLDIPEEGTSVDLNAEPLVTAKPEPQTFGADVNDEAQVGVDVNGDSQLTEEEDITLDDLFIDPRIERVLKPYEELTELLHIAHGDQMTVRDLVEGINEGKADSTESELFREMVRLKGAPAAMEWLNATQQSINHMAYNNGLTDTIERTNSRWLQGILIDDQVRGGYRPKINNGQHKKGGRLSGREAMIRIRQEMQIGDFITFPIPHSGLWLTLLVAGEDEMVNFHTRVLASKAVLGRRTAGLVFSNSDVVVLRHLWDMLANMVVNTSMGKVNKKELTALIKIQDIPLIVGYYMAARFRSGYMLAQPCQVDPAKCGHVDVQKVNIGRLIIIDNERLTTGQLAHMRKQSNHTPESVAAYQEYFSSIRDNVVKLTPTIRVVFSIPSIDNKLAAGNAWLDAIEDSVTLSFKDELSREQRVQYINKQAAITALRNYAHWVSRIDYLNAEGDVDGYVEGEEDIYEALKEHSTNDEFKEAFYKEVGVFINDTTVGVVALPRYKCPGCGQRQPAVGEKFPAFTPINMERCFFTLLTNTLNSSIASADI